MRTYDEICIELGYDKNLKCPITVEKTIHAYKNGICAKFDTIEQAKKFSTNVSQEVDLESKAAYDAWWKDRTNAEAKVVVVWEKEFRKEFSELSDKLFNICYDEAYDRSHSYGFDEMLNTMYNVVAFANDIMKAQNE